MKTIDGNIEHIISNDTILCIISKANVNPEQTSFLTSDESNVQVGYIVYSKGKEIRRHKHIDIQRTIQGTSEVLIVRKGRCEISIYNDNNELVAQRQLNRSDVVIILAGGHGFKMNEDTILLEIKQGPYFGDNEKEYF